MLLLSACGSDAPADEQAASSSEQASAFDDDDPLASVRPPGFEKRMEKVKQSFNSFELRVDKTPLGGFDVSDLTAVGDCQQGRYMEFSIAPRGSGDPVDNFSLNIQGDPPAAGDTGTFPLRQVIWREPGASEGMIGSGTLTLTRHDPGGKSGRMVGSIEADVGLQDKSRGASIDATFDMNFGC